MSLPLEIAVVVPQPAIRRYVAIVVVKAFISIVTRFGFAPFAWYRIVAGAAALAWLTLR